MSGDGKGTGLLQERLTIEAALKSCTVEVWDGDSEDAQQVDTDARVVDAVRIGDRWHLVVVADV